MSLSEVRCQHSKRAEAHLACSTHPITSATHNNTNNTSGIRQHACIALWIVFAFLCGGFLATKFPWCTMMSTVYLKTMFHIWTVDCALHAASTVARSILSLLVRMKKAKQSSTSSYASVQTCMLFWDMKTRKLKECRRVHNHRLALQMNYARRKNITAEGVSWTVSSCLAVTMRSGVHARSITCPDKSVEDHSTQCIAEQQSDKMVVEWQDNYNTNARRCSIETESSCARACRLVVLSIVLHQCPSSLP